MKYTLKTMHNNDNRAKIIEITSFTTQIKTKQQRNTEKNMSCCEICSILNRRVNFSFIDISIVEKDNCRFI